VPEDRPLEFTDEDMRRLEAELMAHPDGPELIQIEPDVEEENRPAMLVQDAEILVFNDDEGVEFLAFRPRDPEELAVLIPLDESTAEEIVEELVRGGLLSVDQLRGIADWAEGREG
jgi:hypothetical protein